MATLFLKGIQREYHLEENSGKKIKELFDNATIQGSHVISVGALSFRKSDIKTIMLDGEYGASEKNEIFRKKMNEWNDYWNRYVNSEEKAKNSKAIFDIMWFARTGSIHSSQEIWKIGYQRAKEFFENNPNRTVVNIKVWKDIFPQKIKLNAMSECIASSGIKMILLCYEQDSLKSKRSEIKDIPF